MSIRTRSIPAASAHIRSRLAVGSVLLASALGCALPAQAKSVVNPASIVGKVLVGYQAWFRCPGDGSPGNNWSHQSAGYAVPTPSNLGIDNYPDVTGLDPASLCLLQNFTTQGKPAYLFSSFPKQTAETHFAWMKEFGIDGALDQRFIGEISTQRAENETILKNVMAAAQDNGRVFAVEYDLSYGGYASMTDDQIIATLQSDWEHLVNDLKLTASPSYLKQNGKPLVSIWGLGFNDNGHIHDAALALRIINLFKQTEHTTVMGGVPWGWATPGQGGAAPGADWPATYAQLDIVQPWTVGTYNGVAQVNDWKTQHLIPDMALTAKNNQLYMPVILPGSANHNASGGTQPINGNPRLGGSYFWAQGTNAVDVGVAAIKVAMFDELNEGTAILKVTSKRSQAPDQGYWLTLDADGYDLPSDWYMRLAYEIRRTLAKQIPNVTTMPATPWLTTAANCAVLPTKQRMLPNQPIDSCDGRMRWLLQGDGNLVVYHGSTPLWASGTAGLPVAYVSMQHNGNLVEFDVNGKSVWSSGSSGHPGAFARVQDDGKLTIVDGNGVVTSFGN